MRTVKDIQKEVLATAQVTLDELRASIEKFWEQGWVRCQLAGVEHVHSKYYLGRMESAQKDYDSTKRLYTMIAEGVTPNIRGEYPTEADKEYARERLANNEERYPRILNEIKATSLRHCYYEMCGYTFEENIPYQPNKSFSKTPEYQKNMELQKSGVLSIFFYCGTRDEFEANRDKEIKYIIEMATAKLKLQVAKKLAPIKDEIQSFDLISFHGQQGNYVGEWIVITAGSRYLFKTSCILAGGYNIQCLHVRYIANLKQLKTKK